MKNKRTKLNLKKKNVTKLGNIEKFTSFKKDYSLGWSVMGAQVWCVNVYTLLCKKQ